MAKDIASKSFPNKIARRKRVLRGSALLIVLAAVVLVTGLTLALLTAIQMESVSAKAATGSSAVLNLANTALQCVVAQITDGTAGVPIDASGNPQDGTVLAWASQPGMIRTYDNTGNPVKYFKLYSSDTMTVTDPANFSVTADVPPADWNTGGNQALYTDLNAPVYDASGTLNYPILDPGALPANGGVVQGISINSPPGYASGSASPTNNPAPMPTRWIYELKDGTFVVPSSINGNAAVFSGANSPTTANPIIGRIAFWTDDETCKVNINTAGEGVYWDAPHFPGGSNTRDGSLNVAAPASTFSDVNYAWNQPFQNEFQRYPGHPAGVALSPILPSLQPLAASASTIHSPAAATLSTIMASVTPRLAPGGSAGGTASFVGGVNTINLASAARQALYASIDELLFASNGTGSLRSLTPGPSATTGASNQLVSKADLERSKFFITANSRAPEVNLFNLPRISIWPIHLDLATNPTSPYTSPFDRLSAFCSSIGTPGSGATPAIYHFQRAYPQDTTSDYSQIPRNPQLYQYLQNLTGTNIPGFGGSFLSKYPLDRDQILTEIFDYIRCSGIYDPSLGNLPSGTFQNTTYQYAPMRNTSPGNPMNGQVVPIHIGNTMGFGRCNNLVGMSVLFIATAESPQNPPQQTTGYSLANGDGNDYFRAVSSQGLSSPALTSPPYSQTVPGNPPSTESPWINPTIAGTNLVPASHTRYVQMILIPDIYNVAPGLTFYGADLQMRIKGLDSMTLNGQALFDAPSGGYYTDRVFATNFNNADGGNYDARMCNKFWLFQHRDWHNQYNDLYWPHAYNKRMPAYQFISKVIQLDSTLNKMPFQSGPLTIEMWSGHDTYDSSDFNLSPAYEAHASSVSPYLTYGGPMTSVFSNPANLIQTVNMQFPSGSFPQPTLIMPQVNGSQIKLAAASPIQTTGTGQSDDMDDAFTEAWSVAGRLNMLSSGNNSYGSPPHYTLPSFPIHGNYSLASNPGGNDVLRSMYNPHGDNRMLAASQAVPAGAFIPSPDYQSKDFLGINYMSYEGAPNTNTYGIFGPLITAPGKGDSMSDIPYGAGLTYSHYNDYDLPTVSYFHAFGGFINKPDEGDEGTTQVVGTFTPYFNVYNNNSIRTPGLYTPNKILSSPGMFGSLPTAIMTNNQNLGAASNNGPWTTLLFRPQQGHGNHGVGQNLNSTPTPPYTIPPDHLLMDLFWMPIVEPYAISDQLSTAGKINMNYQILPYTYITRNTGLVALLKNAKMVAEPNDAANGSNGNENPIYNNTNGFRLSIDTTEAGSLRQFKERFDNSDIFRSATQICDIYLMPSQDAKGNAPSWASNSDAEAFWTANTTADNMREKVYSELYPRLTTKSNTYLVHVRVQSLQKTPTTPANEWVEGTDSINSEYRGSNLVERYIDTNNATIPDFAVPANYNRNLRTFYQLRILSQRQFAP